MATKILICLHEITDRLILINAHRNDNKALLNKLIIIGTDYLDFHEGQHELKTLARDILTLILFIGLFCLCAHPTITKCEHLYM